MSDKRHHTAVHMHSLLIAEPNVVRFVETIHHAYQFMWTICVFKTSRAVFRMGTETFS